MRIIRLIAASSLAACLWSAQYQNGQAARAVIGQPSFSDAGPGIAVSSLLAANGQLYATDTTQRLIAFDLGKLPSPQDVAGQGSGCAVCGFAAVVAAPRSSLSPANLAMAGKTVVLADTPNHRVLIWRDTSAVSHGGAPDLVLGQPFVASEAISGATLDEPVSVAFDGQRLFVGDAGLHRVLVWNSLPTSGDQPADVVLGQPDFTSTGAPAGVDAESIGDPVALASDGTNLFVADATYRRILVFTAADTTLADTAIANAASFASGPLAPGTLIDIHGSSLADAPASAPDDGVHSLPSELGGVEVVFDGLALPLLSVSPNEVRAQLPYNLGKITAASIYVRTEHSDGSVTVTDAAGVKISAADPGLFAFGTGQEPRSGLVAHAGGEGQSGTPVTNDDPVRPGQVVTLWAAGLGIVSSNDSPLTGIPFAGPGAQVATALQAVAGGQPAEVLSAILPAGSVGVYEIRVLLPDDLPANPKTPLFVVENGHASNTVTFPVVP